MICRMRDMVKMCPLLDASTETDLPKALQNRLDFIGSVGRVMEVGHAHIQMPDNPAFRVVTKQPTGQPKTLILHGVWGGAVLKTGHQLFGIS